MSETWNGSVDVTNEFNCSSIREKSNIFRDRNLKEMINQEDTVVVDSSLKVLRAGEYWIVKSAKEIIDLELHSNK